MSRGGYVFREAFRRFKRDVASCTADFALDLPLDRVCLSIIEAHEVFCLGIRLVRRWDTQEVAHRVADIKADMKALQALAAQALTLLGAQPVPAGMRKDLRRLADITRGDEWWLRNHKIVEPLRQMTEAAAAAERLAALERLPTGRATRQKWLTDESAQPSWVSMVADPRCRRFRN